MRRQRAQRTVREHREVRTVMGAGGECQETRTSWGAGGGHRELAAPGIPRSPAALSAAHSAAASGCMVVIVVVAGGLVLQFFFLLGPSERVTNFACVVAPLVVGTPLVVVVAVDRFAFALVCMTFSIVL